MFFALAPCAKALSQPQTFLPRGGAGGWAGGPDVNGVSDASWGASYSCEAARLFLPLFLVDFSSRSKENKIAKLESQVLLPSLPHTVKRASTPSPPQPPPHPCPRPTHTPPPPPELPLHSPLCSIPSRGAVKWSRGKKALCSVRTPRSFSRSVDNPLWTCQPTQEY